MNYSYRAIKKIGSSGLAEICGESDFEKSHLGTVEGTDIPGIIKDEGVDYHVVSIDDYAFTCEGGMKAVIIPWGVISIGMYAFEGCTNITGVELPESLKVISEGAFNGCYQLRSIELPESIIHIGNYAFGECSQLEMVISKSKIPIKLEGGAFKNVSQRCKLIVPYGLKKYYINNGWTEEVFGGGIEEERQSPVVEPKTELMKTWENIVERAKKASPTITTVIGRTKGRIEDGEFERYTGLDTVVLPEGIRVIGNDAFAGCDMKKVELPESLEIIGSSAFSCTELRSVRIPKNVRYISSTAFCYCPQLASISVDAENPYYDSRDDCNGIIETSTNRMLVSCKTTVIPNGLTSIEDLSWEQSTADTIRIPDGVTRISEYAFSGCKASRVIAEMRNPCWLERCVFPDITDDCELLVPQGLRDAYIDMGWTDAVFGGGIKELNNNEI